MYGQQETFTYVRATSLAKHDAHWNAPNAFRQANAARRSASLDLHTPVTARLTGKSPRCNT